VFIAFLLSVSLRLESAVPVDVQAAAPRRQRAGKSMFPMGCLIVAECAGDDAGPFTAERDSTFASGHLLAHHRGARQRDVRVAGSQARAGKPH
jgi:hypothetical protein